MTSSVRDVGSSQRWLITFADLAAVLLAFFVLMFAMTEVDTDKWDGAVNALSRRLYVQSDDNLSSRPQAELNVTVIEVEAGQSLPYLAALLKQQLAEAADAVEVDVDSAEDRVTISLTTKSLFVGAGTDWRPEGRRLAFGLSGILAGLRNRVAVVSYARTSTEDALLAALLRAVALENALRAGGFDREIRVVVRPVGFAQRAQVRKIDIVVLDARDSG